ncbi:MAG: PAS domain S-box protein [Actinobacteria bacterium]|nr:MAG: PAS domain S-box protein [Actinomycetota bacterium]
MSRVRELNDFFEYLPVPLYRSARDGELLAGNRALSDIFGFDSVEEMRAHSDEVTGFYTDPSVRETWLAEIIEKGVVHDFDVELRRRDGQVMWVRDTARAVYDENGDIRYFEGCLIDVTERVRLERSRDRFIATVSHELRSPITAIFGLGSELQNRYDEFEEPDRIDMIKLMTREAEEASWLIEDLLVAHREDLAGVSISPDVFPIAVEVGRVMEGVEAEMAVAGGDGLSVKADPLRTRQILRNLVTNAVRYGGPEGKIEITSDNGFVAVAVCDSGEPIDEATLQSIFEPFVTARSHAQSVGLGLWISRRLAELMDGSVGYEHDGHHSKFVLRLPSA